MPPDRKKIIKPGVRRPLTKEDQRLIRLAHYARKVYLEPIRKMVDEANATLDKSAELVRAVIAEQAKERAAASAMDHSGCSTASPAVHKNDANDAADAADPVGPSTSSNGEQSAAPESGSSE